MLIQSRRSFMKVAVASVGAVSALATGSTPYQALVCIYLAGGNDGHNMVVPITTAKQNYALYSQGRQSLAIPQAQLLPIQDGSDTYGLHPMMSEIKNLYQAGNAALVANVGMLVQPTTRQIFQANNLAKLPSQLFSHSDQTNQWQAAIPNGSASTGWGGRVEDALQAQYNSGSTFTPMTSFGGCGLFCTGQQTFAATVPPSGPAAPQRLSSAGQQLMTFDNGLKLVSATNATFSRGVNYSAALTGALAQAKVTTVFPSTPLGAQLQTAAKIMSVRNALGIGRQVFFCQLGGFDTHSSQAAGQDPLLQQLSQAIGAFYTATQELGTDQATTTFTASEFGRTLQPNGSAGTDHAWGSHHIVVGTGTSNGGSLQGGKIWGQFPTLALGGPDDANTRGTLVPTTSVDQYSATMAKWFGVAPGSIGSIFPYVGNFPTADLGFLG